MSDTGNVICFEQNFDRCSYFQVQRIRDCVTESTDIYEIQRNIRLMSIFCQILETFNANVEILLSSIDQHTYDEVMAHSPKSALLRVKDWLCDLSAYQVGDNFHGYISYVFDGDAKLCFIKDMSK